MQTNQMMAVNFSHGVLHIGHLDCMGDIHELFDIGNGYRKDKGLRSLNIDKYLSIMATKELIDAVSEKIGRPSLVSKTGRGGWRKAHLYILLDAAMYLDVDLKLEVIDVFVNSKLLLHRDASGDGFVELNAQLALTAEELLGKPAHKGHYIQLAKELRSRVLAEEHPGWNNATAKELAERYRIERGVCDVLRLGLVKDWDQLKDVIRRI